MTKKADIFETPMSGVLDSVRLTTMQAACRALPRGEGLFLFTDAKSFREQPDILALRWQTVRTKITASLID
jgi:hypothetical protein